MPGESIGAWRPGLPSDQSIRSTTARPGEGTQLDRPAKPQAELNEVAGGDRAIVIEAEGGVSAAKCEAELDEVVSGDRTLPQVGDESDTRLKGNRDYSSKPVTVHVNGTTTDVLKSSPKPQPPSMKPEKKLLELRLRVSSPPLR